MIPHDVLTARIEAVERHGGNVSAAARELGIAKSTLQECIGRYRHPREIPNAVVSRTTTLYDDQGRVRQQWVREDRAQRDEWEAWAEGLRAELPRIEPIPLRCREHRHDLLTVYPVGDHHLGMLSWAQETGDDYDLDIGTRLLENAMSHLIDIAPASEECLIAFLGDFAHYDSFDSVTPTNRNLLDADGRFPKLVRASIRCMRRAIELAAEKHARVRVIVEIGNHDLSSSIFLMEALANIYELNSRISIDTSPKHFHYYTFGKCLLGTHHGHGVKPDKLPIIMATDRAEDWGRCQHRTWMTGHIHSQTFYDFPGCSVESFRVLAPQDAWAANKGFRSRRDMKSLVFHKEYGEVSRMTVSPLMVPSQ